MIVIVADLYSPKYTMINIIITLIYYADVSYINHDIYYVYIGIMCKYSFFEKPREISAQLTNWKD